MPAWEITVISVFSVIGFLFILFLLLGQFVFKSVFKRNDNAYGENSRLESPDKKYRLEYDDDWIKANPFSVVKITSKDGLKLNAHYIKVKDSHKYIISCHGYLGAWKELTLPDHYFFDKGFSLYMIDERAQGDSEGKFMSFGHFERDDILCWVNHIIKEDPEAQIVLYGLSMGAGSVMMSLNNCLPSNVKCAVADCGYSSIHDEVTYIMKKVIKGPTGIFMLALEFNCYFFHSGYSLKKYSPVKSLHESNIPIYIVHGAEDTYVPTFMAKINYDAVKNGTYKKLEIFPIAYHALSYQVDKNKYLKEMSDFIQLFVK